MAKYTIELRSLFEPYRINPPLYTRQEVENVFKDYELTDFLTQDQISVITTAGIWSKDKLATQIVDHYYMRELGFETPALFFHYAKVTMKELMEEYLPLIYSASIEYDPLVNVDFTETLSRQTSGLSTGSNTGSSNSNSSSNSSGLTINSDTPQGRVNKANILAGNYATTTSANENENAITDTTSTSGSSSMNSSGTEAYTKRMIGNSGVSATAQKMIEQYRNNIRAINREIIDKLSILFMGLY